MKVKTFKKILLALNDDVDIYVSENFEIYEPHISSKYDEELDENYFVITK